MRSRSSITSMSVVGALALATASLALGQEVDDAGEAPAEAPETAPCPAPALVPQLMTPAAGRIPRDGALVVGLFPGGSDTSGTLPALTLTRGRRTVALQSQPVAPGLFRLVHEGRIGGRYNLEGVAGNPRLYFRRSPLPATPAAPRLERVERYLVADGTGRRLEVRAHFADPLPNDVVAVVSYWGADDEPDAFVRSTPSQRSLVLFSRRDRCDPRPPGTNAPPETGGTVRVALVDRVGQVSPLSEARPIR